MNRFLRSELALLVSPLAAMLLWLLPAAPVGAVSCSASMTAVNFGSIDLVASTGGTTTATLSYTCTNNASSKRYIKACFSIGDGSQGFVASSFTRQMTDGSSNSLQFQLYWPDNTTIWGSAGFGSSTPVSVTRTIAGNSQVSGTVTMNARLVAGQTSPPPSTAYLDDFNGVHTAAAHSESTSSTPAGCTSVNDGTFGFAVNATVIKSCTVTAADLDFGAQDFTATNVAPVGNGSVSVTCSKGTTYTIGLAPNSTGAATGAGTMAGTGSNTDKVPYQLYSNPALTSVWGNTPGANTIAGTGTGVVQAALMVYGIVPNANYTPDSYKDTVTVNVRY